MAKLGYYGGNPDTIMDAPVKNIIDIISFEKFEAEYRDKFAELNHGD